MRNLRQPRDVGVNVEAHAGLGVPEPAGEFDGSDSLLMPQGSPAVAKAMWAETGEAHSGTNLVSVRDAEWEAALERGDKEAWGINCAAHPLPLGSLARDTNGMVVNVYVGDGEPKRFGYSGAEYLHRRDGESVARIDSFEDGDNRVLVGWYRLSLHHAWKLDAPVPRDVRDTGEIQHHAELPDEETNRAGLVGCGEYTDPGDCLAYCYLLGGPVPECVHQHGSTEAVTAPGAVSYVPTRGEPFSVDIAKVRTTDYGSIQLHLRILRGGKPIAYEVHPNICRTPSPERATVLHLRIPAAPAVADVEPAAVPGVPSTDVEGRQ